MNRSIAFFAIMALASAISVAKSAVLAAVFSLSDFTEYAASFAVVGIASSVLSFGLTEGMVKTFTRLAAFGRTVQLREELSRGVRLIAKRHAIALVVVLLITAVPWTSPHVLPAVSIIILCFATNCLSVASSLLRGYDRLITMGSAALVRAVCALSVTTAIGWLFGWKIGFFAEAVSSATVAIVFLFYLRQLIRRQAIVPQVEKTGPLVADKRDGFYLFLGFSIALLPPSFDRSWIALSAPGLPAAQYAFAGVFIMAATTVSAIYVQKLGPELVRRRANSAGFSMLRTSFLHSFGLAAILTGGAACALAAIYLFGHVVYWEKYGLTPFSAALIGLACAAQVNPIFDWALIALDGERGVFLSAVVFSTASATFFAWCTFTDAGFLAYILSIAVGRILQMLTAMLYIFGLEKT